MLRTFARRTKRRVDRVFASGVGLRSMLGGVFGHRAEMPAPLVPLARLVESYGAGGSMAQFLYFGDSVLERVAKEDADRRALYQMFADRVAPRRVCSLSQGAFHPGVFLASVRCLRSLEHRPELAIVPINLRCFSPQWDLEPAYQFTGEIALLNNFAANPSKRLPSFTAAAVDREQYEVFDRTPISIVGSRLTTVGEFRLVISASPQTEVQTRFREQQVFSFFYMYRLAREHRRVVALRELFQTLGSLGIPVLVYITPINIGAARAVLGEAFSSQIRSNVATLVEALADVRVIDWSTEFPPEMFFHRKFHTEHLNERGRKRLVELVAGELAK